jgi:hypothetical protein
MGRTILCCFDRGRIVLLSTKTLLLDCEIGHFGMQCDFSAGHFFGAVFNGIPYSAETINVGRVFRRRTMR